MSPKVQPNWWCNRYKDGTCIYWDPAVFTHNEQESLKLMSVEQAIAYISTNAARTHYHIEYPGSEPAASTEHSGGSVNYYKVQVTSPDSEGVEPYQAECTDLIEALGMTFAEANIFKEIWRSAAARTLGKKKAGHDAIYGAEKIVYFAERNLRRLKRNS